MLAPHIIRVGAMGQVGRFVPVEPIVYPRRSRVVLRTVRGLEVGEVLATSAGNGRAGQEHGQILRAMTPEDEMLQERLERYRADAYEACERLLAENGHSAALLDVELLFDGQNLLFYFLGEVEPEVAALTASLAEAYESTAQLRRFSETLLEGCGPDCGTEAAGGGACDSCSGCAVASACGPRTR